MGYLEQAGASTVTIEHAIAWATQPAGGDCNYWCDRLSCSGRFGPRPHDLRHSFAVSTLLDWYATDTTNVQARLPSLSTYLGHVEPASTYYYLTAAPELLRLAARRLEPAQKGL